MGMEQPISPYESKLSPDVLRLDPQNPRLPENIQSLTDVEILKYIAQAYEPIAIGRSIVHFGYFLSEPLIVISDIPPSEFYIVLEGNRRLTALRLLQDPGLAEGLDDESEWISLAAQNNVPDEIPVIIANRREDVAPIIGFRHISGIEPWDPYQKARFIANLIDNDGFDFDNVSKIVGERPGDVAAAYRNFRVVAETSEKLKIDTNRVIGEFGVFTRLMTSSGVRAVGNCWQPAKVGHFC